VRPAAPRAREGRDESGPVGPLSIELACPKCGAPFAADDETVSVKCEHCGSLLLLSAPEREEICLADSPLLSDADLLDIVILYRVQSRRAEIVSRYTDGDGNRPSEVFIEGELRRYEETLRHATRLLEAHPIHVPYWHVSGLIAQAILGRHHDGPKRVKLRAFGVESTVPGYDTNAANLRDRGLRLSAARVRPLSVRDVRERGRFLPWLVVPERSNREIDRWLGRDLDRELEPVAKHGQFLRARRVLVYRPYWLAHVISDTSQEWVLVDGTFGTLGGHPDELEVRSLALLGVADPLGSGGDSYRRVNVIPSRCPDCGFEQSLSGHDVLVICPNCLRALAPGPDGIHLTPYSHVPGEGTDCLPFWRFRFELRIPGSPPLRRLEDYAKALFGKLPPGLGAAGEHLWVPAFRLLGTAAGDAAFQALVAWVHAAGLQVAGEKLAQTGWKALWGVSVPEQEARGLAPFALLGMHGSAAAARLNAMTLRKAVGDGRLGLSDPTLVLVPFIRVGEELEQEGVRVASLLLRGGPELQAQRATVFGASDDVGV
jgi:DNA-directed RNA polymerase subunit RPC12/RpoP